MHPVSNTDHASHAAPSPAAGSGAASPSSPAAFSAALNQEGTHSSAQGQAPAHGAAQSAPGAAPAGASTASNGHVQSGASLLGHGEFSYDQPHKLTPEAISGAHNQLQSNGYKFAGWHGTSQTAAASMVNGDIRGSKFTTPGEQHWSGLYTGNDVKTAAGYAMPANVKPEKPDSALARMYVKGDAVQHVSSESGNINDIKPEKLPPDVRNGTGKYVLSGPENTGGPHESVIGNGMLGGGNTVAIPSLHGANYTPDMQQPAVVPHGGEAQSVGPNLFDRTGGLAGA